MSISVFLAKLEALKNLYKVIEENYTYNQISEYIDLEKPMIDFLKPKQTTCLGCLYDAPDQRSHMDIGGCLYNDY